MRQYSLTGRRLPRQLLDWKYRQSVSFNDNVIDFEPPRDAAYYQYHYTRYSAIIISFVDKAGVEDRSNTLLVQVPYTTNDHLQILDRLRRFELKPSHKDDPKESDYPVLFFRLEGRLNMAWYKPTEAVGQRSCLPLPFCP